jgi:ATP-binding cassette subfamily B protein
MKLKSRIKQKLSKSSVYQMYADNGTEYWRYILVAVLFGAIGTALTQIPQIAFGLVVEVIESGSSPSQFPFADIIFSQDAVTRITQVSVVFIVSVILVAVLKFISSYFWDVFKESFKDDIRVEAYESIQNLHPKRFIQRSSGEYVSVVESDVSKVGGLPRTVISGVTNDIVNVLTIGVVLFSLNWQLSILMLIPLPLIAWYTFKFNEVIEPLYKNTRKASASLTDQLSSSIRGVLTVRSYVAENREKKRVDDASDEVRDTQLDISKTWLLYSKVFSLTSRITSFVVLSLGSYWVVVGPPLFFTEPLTAGELAVFFTNSTLLIQPATSVRSYVDTYKKAKASSDRIYAIIQAKDIDEKSYDEEFSDVDGKISFKDVRFKYEFSGEDPLDTIEDDESTEDEENDDFMLGPVSCTISEGETVGVVGPSGSGKTTFIRLLMRFLDTDYGSIYVDDNDISNYNPRTLRDKIGYVEQEPYVFDSTIADNVRYGEVDASNDDVKNALENAAIKETILNMEDGIETDLGEEGGRMSGGEKQRVAIARAILTHPSILVLDEATSHVDNITESKIQESIDKATKNRTTIIIAHRLSTVRNADKILVFDEGQIVERGSHEELTNEDGLYAELWNKHVGLS